MALYPLFKNRIFPIVIGITILCTFSILQKLLIGAPIIVKGFIAPFIFGGISGSIIGAWRLQVKSAIDKLKQNESNLEQIISIRTSELQKANEILSKISMHDPLTDLPNRRYFREHIDNKLAQAKRDNEKIAFLYIDLDSFKSINDEISHHAGDEVLTDLAKKFNKVLRKNEFIARLGGDEFCMVIYNYKNKEELKNTATRLINKSTQALSIGGMEIKLGMTIGISLYPEDGKTYEELLSAADEAMYHAKNKERGTYSFFS